MAFTETYLMNKQLKPDISITKGDRPKVSPVSQLDIEVQSLLTNFRIKNYEETIRLGKLLCKQSLKSNKIKYIIAASYAALNNRSEAIRFYREIIKKDHNEYTAHANLGALLFKIGAFSEAKRHLRVAISLDEKHLNAYMILGIVLQSQNEFEEACKVYKKAIANCSQSANLYNSYGIALRSLKDFNKAEEILGIALTIDPTFVKAQYNLGNVYLDQNKLEEAVNSFKDALKIDREHFNSNFYLGITYEKLGELEHAKQIYEKLIKSPKCNTEVYMQIAAVCVDILDLPAATKYYERVLSIEPTNSDAKLQLGMLKLKQKKFRDGFLKYESRWQTNELKTKKIPCENPFWNGENDKTIHVWSEQGIGDVIMFASILPDLLNISQRVIVSCDSRLIPLFSNSFCERIRFIDKDSLNTRNVECDYQIPFGSLPKFFRKSEQDFLKSADKYLKINKEKSDLIKKQIKKDQDVTLVGLSWQGGSPGKRLRRQNKVELASLIGLLSHPKNKFVNLQYGDVKEEIRTIKSDFDIKIHSMENIDLFNDFDGLSSIMGACDRIVSVDNLNVHLAGAIGIPTDVFLPYANDWRWGISGASSYWHKSLTLHRQTKPESWLSVFEKLKQDGFNNKSQ